MKGNKYEIILAEAARLIGHKGYAGTSFQEIADAVGVHKSTLFHYFKNKEELLLWILKRSIKDVYTNLERIANDETLRPEEKLQKAIQNHLTMLVRYFDNINVYINEFTSLSKKNQVTYLKKRKKYENDFQKIIKEMQAVGYFRGLNPKIVTFGILGMQNWSAKWFKLDGEVSMDEVSRIFYQMVAQGGAHRKE